MDFQQRLTAIWARFKIGGHMAEMRPTMVFETNVRGGSKADYVQVRGFQGYSAQASIRRHDGRQARRVEEIRNAIDSHVQYEAARKLSELFSG